MTAKINMRHYVVFIKPQNFDTADIKCYSIPKKRFLRIIPAGECSPSNDKATSNNDSLTPVHRDCFGYEDYDTDTVRNPGFKFLG